MSTRKRKTAKSRRDWGRVFAIVLCSIFALIGAIPLALGFIVRMEWVRSWAADETARVLKDNLGVVARYRVEVQAWPMVVGLSNVEVDATDGGAAFARVEKITVRPRPFSLLAGRLDAGEVEIDRPWIRAVLHDGALSNLALTLPASDPNAKASLPFTSLAVTEARLDLTVTTSPPPCEAAPCTDRGRALFVLVEEVDADVAVEPFGAVELALRGTDASIVHVHEMPDYPGEDAIDDDRVCKLEVRARADQDGVFVRRLSIAGSVDFDPDADTNPGCALASDDWRAFEVALGAFRVSGKGIAPPGMTQDPTVAARAPRVSGRISAKIPVGIAHRFVKIPHASGQVILDVEVDHTLALPGDDGSPAGSGGKKRALLPLVRGTLDARMPGIDGKVFSERLTGNLVAKDDAVLLTSVNARWAGGDAKIPEVKVEPFAPGAPLTAGPVTIEGVEMVDLMRDLGVHPQAHVGWSLRDVFVPEFKGTLSPLDLSGPLAVKTEGFALFDRSARSSAKHRLIGLPEATVKGTLAIKPDGVAFNGFSVDGNKTHLKSNVFIAFKGTLSVDVLESSTIDLAEVSPLGEIPIAGKLDVSAAMRGPLYPQLPGKLGLNGKIAISDFVFGGLPVGNVESAKVAFEPLVLTVTEAKIKKRPQIAEAREAKEPKGDAKDPKGESKDPREPREPRESRESYSLIQVPLAVFAFDRGPAVWIDAKLDTTQSPHLGVQDLLDILRLNRVQLGDGRSVADPRWAEIDGRAAGTANIHFELGGPADRCGGGILRVTRGDFRLSRLSIYGERYDEGQIDFDLHWLDRQAGANGMKLDLRSGVVRKGEGAVTIGATIRPGGALRAEAVASGIPLSKLQHLGDIGRQLDGTVSAIARIGGTLDALDGLVDVEISRVRIGPSVLPASRLAVALVPDPAPKPLGITGRCKNPIGAGFDLAKFEADTKTGNYRVDGGLFGGQVKLANIEISQQRGKVVRGSVELDDLNLGALANLLPDVAFSGEEPQGRLSAKLDVRKLPLADIAKTDMTLVVSRLDVSRNGDTVRLLKPTDAIVFEKNKAAVPGLRLMARTESGLSAVLVAQGTVSSIFSAPVLDVGLVVEPISLSQLSRGIPSIERAGGTVDASLRMTGSPQALTYTGSLSLTHGELAVKGLPLALTDIEVGVDIRGGEVRIRSATARAGGGALSVTGGMPLRGFSLGTATASIEARGVRLPVAEGVQLTADADLTATLRPGAETDEMRVPRVQGTVSLTQFAYTRPIELSVSLNQLSAKPRTSVETYDPKNDAVAFDLQIVSPKPLRFTNNLVDMQLEVQDPGLALSGTNQRFGAKGLLRILPFSKLRLRNSEFEVREGSVRFEDPYKITPKVDVRATTEYRRLTSASTPDTQGGAEPAGAPSSGTAPNAGDLWRITMHAYGNADALKVDLTSDPGLSQEDIVLLLTFGLTRAELDQGFASDQALTSVGGTLGLEAISTLTGADKAVKSIVPIIDEVRFGTAYSARAGRTQPVITFGKRVTDSVQAHVTTGISENRDVRSTIEWRLDGGVILQGSYDNLNDTFGLPIGNVGADLRWRLAFE